MFSPRLCFICLLALGLAACKTELYSSLPEEQANEMVALLIGNGIEAEKGAAAKGMVPVSVPTADMSKAVEILRNNGYPKDTFDSLGTVFDQKGLVSSPLEERVRFIYGLSQTLSETLNQIDGVTTARVHIVLPEEDSLNENPGKSTASVFLKTRPGVDLSNKIPDIKQLVQASVQDLAYDDVVVSLFEGAAPPVEFYDSSIPPKSEETKTGLEALTQHPILIVGAGMFLLIGVGAAVFFVRRGGGKSSGSKALVKAKPGKPPKQEGAAPAAG